ncbi:MAG TPA: response regulator [Chitinophagaceae bacterium]|nr:response regulator [Chitinophagaceae bacterium]
MNERNDILLVEDSPSDAELTIWALRENNINGLLHLKNGEEALEYIFATGKYVDRNIDDLPKLILLDLKMPKINGLEVLKKIKSDERTKIIPVVLLTSSKEDNDILDSYKLGVNSYIVKPVEFENFVKAVSNVGLYWLLINQSPI